MSLTIVIRKSAEFDMRGARLESEFKSSPFAAGLSDITSITQAVLISLTDIDPNRLAWLKGELGAGNPVKITDAIQEEEGSSAVILSRPNGAYSPMADTVYKLLLIKYPILSSSLRVKEYPVFFISGEDPQKCAECLRNYLLDTGEYRALLHYEPSPTDPSEEEDSPKKAASKSLAPKENAELSEPYMTTQAAKIMDRYIRTDEEMEKCVSLPTRSGVTTQYSTTAFSQIENQLRSLDIKLDKDDAITAQNYFLAESREPTEMELRIINRYRSERWSHSALETSVDIAEISDDNVQAAHESFKADCAEFGLSPDSGTLADIVGMPLKLKYKKDIADFINDEGIKDENSEIVKTSDHRLALGLETDMGKKLLIFAHESNNTRTSVDPSGGASSCLGGSIRKLMRSLASPYDCMRVSGIGSPYSTESDTDANSVFEQRALARSSCDSFASYARTAGIPCSANFEYIGDTFNLKHMEVSAVLATLDPKTALRAQKAEKTITAGDVIMVLGSRTGRDGRVYNRYLKILTDRIAEEAKMYSPDENGGPKFYGSNKLETEIDSKSEQDESVSFKKERTAREQRSEIIERELYAAKNGIKLYGEAVPSGDASIQKKLTRICKNEIFRSKVKKLRDVDSAGIVAAASTLSDGIKLYLDCVPLKYNGMSSTEVAFSETCERLVIAVDKSSTAEMTELCSKYGIICTGIGVVTDDKHLTVYGGGKRIAYLSTDFLLKNRSERRLEATVRAPEPFKEAEALTEANTYTENRNLLKRLLFKHAPNHLRAYKKLAENSKIKTAVRKRRFDNTLNGSTVISQMNDQFASASVSLICDGNKVLTHNRQKLCSAVSVGMHPDICRADPYKGAYYAVTDAIGRLVASGASHKNAYLAIQLFHPTYSSDRFTTGDTLASILGIYDAQKKLDTCSICGDYSLGGYSGEQYRPEVAVFGISAGEYNRFHSSEFKANGNRLALFRPEMGKNGLPLPESQLEIFEKTEALLASGNAVSAVSLTGISLAECVMHMSFGTMGRFGFMFDTDCTPEELYGTLYGAMAVELNAEADIPKGAVSFGHVTDRNEIIIKGKNPKATDVETGGNVIIPIPELFNLCYESSKKVYETSPCEQASLHLTHDDNRLFRYKERDILRSPGDVRHDRMLIIETEKHLTTPPDERKEPKKKSGNKKYSAYQMSFDSFSIAEKNIRVVVPIFKSAIGEELLIRSINRKANGTRVEAVPFLCDLTKASIEELASRITNAGMLLLPDCAESPAVISAILKQTDVAKAINTLKKNCGLIYGMGCGFGALIRAGLLGGDVPTGAWADIANTEYLHAVNGGKHENGFIALEECPLSGLTRTSTLLRVSSIRSPFMQNAELGGIYRSEISAYAGRFVGAEEMLSRAGMEGMIPTQYCDRDGKAASFSEFNPCGSLMSIDSMTSLDGTVMGQISSPERSEYMADPSKDQFLPLPVLESAIKYLSE